MRSAPAVSFRSLVASATAAVSVAPNDVSVAARRDSQLDVMADLLAAHLDLDAVLALLDGGPPVRPTVTSALRR